MGFFNMTFDEAIQIAFKENEIDRQQFKAEIKAKDEELIKAKALAEAKAKANKIHNYIAIKQFLENDVSEEVLMKIYFNSDLQLWKEFKAWLKENE